METSGDQLFALTAPFRDNPGESALVIDFDGVLADIVPHYADAVIKEDRLARFAAVHRAYGKGLTILTGREIEFIRARVPVRGLSVIGLHGAAWFPPGSAKPVIDPLYEPWIARAAMFVLLLRGSEWLFPTGMNIEHLTGKWTVHRRGCPEMAGAEWLSSRIAQLGREAGFRVTNAQGQVEGIPDVEVHKGTAVTRFVSETGSTKLLVIGDEPTDVDAMRAGDAALAAREIDYLLKIGVRSTPEVPPELEEAVNLMIDPAEVDLVGQIA